jgi:peptidyl-dipeptidase A
VKPQKTQRALLAIAISAGLLCLVVSPLLAAKKSESAEQFVARVNQYLKDSAAEGASAQWLSSTYINEDSQRIAAAANERSLAMLSSFVEQAKRYQGKKLAPATARAIELIKQGTSMPAPRDPVKLKELTEIASRMEATYGAGKYCPNPKDPESCQDIGQITDTLAATDKSSYTQQLQAWEGWHTISVPMRPDYQRFVMLTNEGAREMGYANTGAMWRSGYDMPPDAFQAETDRLWGQVKPLYDQLHCYTKTKLVGKYGAEKGQVDGMIPAHLTGNLWQQDWGNLWPMLEPYKGVGSLDISAGLQKQRDGIYKEMLNKAGGAAKLKHEQIVDLGRKADREMAVRMVKMAESFYTGLGMPALPQSFYDDSLFLQPRDRDVVCHASAWPMNMEGDVRIKMCIKPDEDSLTTIYHELGHIYYYMAYKDLSPVFQNGANDGFHEAIGDTIVLSMTPEYMNSIGLVPKTKISEKSVINDQMRMALAKVAFLPFGLTIDRWRWGVFDGSIAPDNYNKAWWELKAKYQGVAPLSSRGENFFDPGAKYHVPGNTPYTRYFLSHILQFQFYKSLCDASGFKGPLHQCSFANNPEAGKRYSAMLHKGASQPWPTTLKELTGGEQMDASAVLEYFAPLKGWLEKQNQGKQCSWEPGES